MPVDFDENAFMARGHVDLNITVSVNLVQMVTNMNIFWRRFMIHNFS